MKDTYIEGFLWLAIYQILGGLLGLFYVGTAISEIGLMNVSLNAYLIAGISLYIYSIYCGIILLQRRVNSLEYSLVNQYLQLLSVAGSSIIFQFVAGFSMRIIFYLDGGFTTGINFSLSSVNLGFNLDNSSHGVGVNLVAGGIVFILHHQLIAISRERTNDQIDSIGS
jgi:hypothetical protein